MPNKMAPLPKWPRTEEKAVKFSGHKTKWHMLSWTALGGAARVMWKGLHVGTDKEREKNDWQKGTDYSQYWDALVRHAFAWWEGQDEDPETRENHLHHVICCAMILVWYQLTGRGNDDRSPTIR